MTEKDIDTNEEKFGKILIEYVEAIDKKDYGKAIEINHIPYEEGYRIYERLLVERRKSSYIEKLIIDNFIGTCKENLERLIIGAARITKKINLLRENGPY